MKKNKKAEVNFLLVSIIIALLLLFSYIIVSSDIISKVFGNVDIIEDEASLKLHCITNDPILDKNGDGFRDEDLDKDGKVLYRCSLLRKTD
jgi:hypothetical protein